MFRVLRGEAEAINMIKEEGHAGRERKEERTLSYIIFISLLFLCISSLVYVLAHFRQGGTNNHVRLVQRHAGLGRLGRLGKGPWSPGRHPRGLRGYLGQSFEIFEISGSLLGYWVCLVLELQRNHCNHQPSRKCIGVGFRRGQ